MRTHQYAAAAVADAGARLLRPTISHPSLPCRRHPCAMKPKARPLTSSAVPPRDAATLPSTRAAGGAASMHAAYEEEDERVLQHVIVVSARAEEARMVAVAAEAGRARIEPANRVQTQYLPSRP